MPTLNVRHVDPATRRRLVEAARARGWTLAVYLERLARLHEDVRTLVDVGQPGRLREVLEALELQTVSR